MAKAPKPLTRQDVQQRIVALAWTDAAFRKSFLADPRREFEKRLGTKLPPGLTVTAIAEDDDHLHFVIPAKPKDAGALSEQDLEKVAGGLDVVAGGVILASFIVTLAGVSHDSANSGEWTHRG